jgi:hypothetical protein
MATTNPSVVRAFATGAQNLYTVSYPFLDTHQYSIAGVSKADPAVVTVPLTDTPVISTTGTVGTIVGSASPWTAVVSNMTSTAGLQTGMIITATDGSGSIGTGEVQVTAILGNTRIAIKAVGGSAPTAGTVTDVSIPATGNLPVGFVDGMSVYITGVGGMTQLKTAGDNGSAQFTVASVTPTSFELSGVDSSGFTTATANTGVFQVFSVPQFNSAGSTVGVLFDATTNGVGTDIDVNLNTGVITLTGGALTYELVATASTNVAGATYQWYDLTNDQAIGTVANVGFPVTALFKNDNDADIALRVTSPAGTSFQYPAQVTNATAVVNVISGFVA